MAKQQLRAWKTISKRTILNPNRFLTVESHAVALPDGQVILDWTWVKIPDAAIVLAMTQYSQFLCFRQIKYAIEGASLAPAAGMLEPGETPLAAAQRELLEETGYVANEWVSLGSYILDPNRGIATMHLFLTLHSKQVADPNSDDLEDQEILLLSRDEIENALRAGEFKILAWSAVVAFALQYLDHRAARSNPADTADRAI
jgi:ADP-ribose pyrophosphatase